MDDSGGTRQIAATIDAWLDRVPLRRVVVEWVRRRRTGVFLVGGTVRDALLRRDSDDLDFAVEGGAAVLAREVADHIGGAYVLMDAGRDVARVLRRSRGRTQQFDFAGLRAADITADLAARDFSVNAMALPVAEGWGALLDPTGGLADLQAGVLRVASSGAFADDPVRVLRMVRLAGSLGLRVDTKTELLARAALPGLNGVSPERLRDEWMLILRLERSAPSVAYAARLGISGGLTATAARECNLERGLQALARLEALEAEWLPGRTGESAVQWGALAPLLAARWREPLTSGRPRQALVRLAALFHASEADGEVEEGGIADAGRALRLSSREVGFLCRATLGARKLTAGSTGAPRGRLDIYRYYRTCGQDGVEGAVLAMAAADGTSAAQVAPHALRFLNAWFYDHGSFVDPPRLITGRDVADVLGVDDGPEIGALLETIREAQVMGTVRTRDEALAILPQALARLAPDR